MVVLVSDYVGGAKAGWCERKASERGTERSASPGCGQAETSLLTHPLQEIHKSPFAVAREAALNAGPRLIRSALPPQATHRRASRQRCKSGGNAIRRRGNARPLSGASATPRASSSIGAPREGRHTALCRRGETTGVDDDSSLTSGGGATPRSCIPIAGWPLLLCAEIITTTATSAPFPDGGLTTSVEARAPSNGGQLFGVTVSTLPPSREAAKSASRVADTCARQVGLHLIHGPVSFSPRREGDAPEGDRLPARGARLPLEPPGADLRDAEPRIPD